ncbi:MAG: hypothetical protein ABID04_01035 [Patescibacteria group bacterium]
MLLFLKRKKILLRVLASILLSIFFAHFTTLRFVNAQETIFYDNFDDEREDWKDVYEDWTIAGGGDKYLTTKFDSQETLSLTVPNEDLLELGNYVVSAKVQSVNGVDQMIWFRVNNEYDSYYAVNLRATGWIDSNNIRVKKVVDGDKVWMCQINPVDIGCSIVHGQWYEVRVSAKDETLDVEIKCPVASDFKNIFSITDTQPLLSGTIGLVGWSGSWDQGVEKWFDEVKVESFGVSRLPLVIIPGLGASWNTDAMVHDQSVGLNDWKETPFVNVYDNLIKTAVDGGFVLGENLFFWNYDWRQPVEQIADDFNQFVTNTPQLASASKIDLVGHSLGGLVANAWGQEFGSGKIENLITVGSPHQGAVKAYRALAGGQLGDNLDLGWLAAQLLFQIHRDGFETNAKLAQQVLPVLSDIAPTFDFLKKQGRTVQSSFPNDWLVASQADQTLLPVSSFLLGNTGQTVEEWLNLANRSYLDQLLDLWPDGIVKSSVKGIGDGSVLKKSAYLDGGFNHDLEFNLSHQQIISDSSSVEKIFEVLDQDLSFASAGDVLPSDNLLIFFLASPATLTVDGQVPGDPQLQFIVISNPETKNYQAQITGTGSGNYHLYLGQITPSGNFWSQYQGNTESGQVDSYSFAVNFSDPQPDPLIDQNGLQHLTQAKQLLEELSSQDSNRNLSLATTRLDLAIGFVNQSKFTKAIAEIKKSLNYLSVYRERLDVSQITRYYQAETAMEKMVSGWEAILTNQSLVSSSRAKTNYRAAQSYYSLANKLLRLAQRKKSSIPAIKAISLKKAEQELPELTDHWRQADYALVESRAYLIRLFAKEGFVR